MKLQVSQYTAMPYELQIANAMIYQPCGLAIHSIIPEAESRDYNAHTFFINNSFVHYRSAKITPTKAGQFVTLWKRNADGPIQPLSAADAFDLCIIATQHANHFGQFIFTKDILSKHGILASTLRDGKRGFRVYLPWDAGLNKQAQKTQQWQLNHFIDLSADQQPDLLKAKHLLQTANNIA